MLTIEIILMIVSISLVIYSVHSLRNVHQLNQDIDKQNQELETRNQELNRECESLTYILNRTSEDINKETYKLNSLLTQSKIQKEQLSDIQSNISKTLDNQKELSQKAFENYCEILEKQYEEEEAEYEGYKDTLKQSYSSLQSELIQEYEKYKAELDKIKSTRTAVIEAQRRERELEGNILAHCIPISEADKADIAKLESLKPSLNKPRILSMLIWQTWFQKPLKTLAAQIVGVEDKTGIYKITNIKTKECYIGQALNIKDRWNEHAKCGLGIDTPAANKLYQSMQTYGLWNFAFEVLEECPKEELNEKEAYYIDLYNSYELGFNSNKGIKK